jgi:hypothetical protein
MSSAERQERASPRADALRLLDGLEDEFDLMRLRRYRAVLEEEDARLREEARLLKGSLADVAPLRWRTLASTTARLLWIRCRRASKRGEWRRVASVERDIRFARRVKARAKPAKPTGKT